MTDHPFETRTDRPADLPGEARRELAVKYTLAILEDRAQCEAPSNAAKVREHAAIIALLASPTVHGEILELQVLEREFLECVYTTMRFPPAANSTAVGKLSQEETAIYDGIAAVYRANVVKLRAALLASSPAPAAPLSSLRRFVVMEHNDPFNNARYVEPEQTVDGPWVYYHDVAALLDPPGRPAHERTAQQEHDLTRVDGERRAAGPTGSTAASNEAVPVEERKRMWEMD